MVTYTPLLTRSQPLIPPPDTLSEATYNSVKLDGLLGGYAEDEEDEEEENETPQISPENDVIAENSTATASESNADAFPANKKSLEHSEYRLLRVIAGAHQGWVRSVVPDPVSNEWFVTGSADATIKIWNLATLQLQATITGHIMAVRALAVSSKYPYLFSGSEDKTVRCWDLERTNHPSGCQIRNYHGHVGGIYAMALHPELDLLFTGGRDQVVRVWDIRTRTEVMVLTGHRSDITSLASQTGDPQVISSSMDGTIRLWDLRKQTTQLALTHHTKSIRSMVMHPEEMTMTSGDSSGNIKQWVLPGGELLSEFGTKEDIINSMAINPTDNTLFAGYDDGKMEFYDYVSGKVIQSDVSTPVPGTNESAIYASSFDMLGLRLIVGEGDKSIKIWENRNN